MKASDLTKVWTMPDNARLTAKQYSIRLPVHVAAKISALCDMDLKENRTEIIGDLLTAAINDWVLMGFCCHRSNNYGLNITVHVIR